MSREGINRDISTFVHVSNADSATLPTTRFVRRRLGCGNTLYNEKREYHEQKLCEWRFIECPLCMAQIRERDKLDHMEIECVRGGHEAVIDFHEKQEAVLRAELAEKEAEARKKKDLFAYEKKQAEEEKKRERENPNADKHMALLKEKEGAELGKGGVIE